MARSGSNMSSPDMGTFRLEIRSLSATLTPWQADTIFGHLCWTIVRRANGETELAEFIQTYRQGNPRLLLSDAFPADFLPVPVLPYSAQPRPANKAEGMARVEKAKMWKEAAFLTPDEFRAACQGQMPDVQRAPISRRDRTVFKNQINRLTGTTTGPEEGAGGNLYSVDELALAQEKGPGRFDAMPLSLYVRIAPGWEDWTRQLFNDMALAGYGKKKSSGYGQFRIASFQPFEGFARPQGANGFVSLSNFVPAGDDPTRGAYRLFIKYGRLGEDYAVSGAPFKLPLVMIRAGATFYVERPKAFFGRLVTGIHRSKPEVVQYGFAFDVPIVLPSV